MAEEEYFADKLAEDDCRRIALVTPNLLPEHPNCTFHLIPKTIQNYQRKKDIHDFFTNLNDVLEFMQANEEVNYRYFVSPMTDLLPIYKYLDFNYDNTKDVIERGKQDMKKAIEMGAGVSFDKIRKRAARAGG